MKTNVYNIQYLDHVETTVEGQQDRYGKCLQQCHFGRSIELPACDAACVKEHFPRGGTCDQHLGQCCCYKSS